MTMVKHGQSDHLKPITMVLFSSQRQEEHDVEKNEKKFFQIVQNPTYFLYPHKAD